MMRLVRYLLSALLILPAAAFAQFEGTLILEPTGCEAAGKCTVKDKFRFIDRNGLVWEAQAGLQTDGASIPTVFQPIIGAPFDPSYVKAAVIHDQYCWHKVRPWRETHRVFYEALIAQGVALGTAKTMYFAVYLGGPKWLKLVPGTHCGQGCINSITGMDGKPVLRSRAAEYDRPEVKAEAQRLAAELEKNPNAQTLEQLEARAQVLRPNDYYYRNGAEVVVTNISQVPLATQ